MTQLETKPFFQVAGDREKSNIENSLIRRYLDASVPDVKDIPLRLYSAVMLKRPTGLLRIR